HKKKQEGFHKCCFSCTICPKETYLNSTGNAYKCMKCKETEWSPPGSTSCFERKQEYVPFNDPGAIGVMVGTLILLIFIAAISVLFALNYNTPVVKSAGGPMCFLILGCLSLCSISVFFYFGEPRVTFCVLRFVPFLLFYTVCLACFAVRSFQIVCIFKISAKFPNISRVWTKYHAHWIFIAAASFLQAILLITHFSLDPPKQFKDTFYSDRFILGCDFDKTLNDSLISIILAFILILLSFCFSYTGKNLPKNYNEAKAITFCMFLLILIWISFATFIKLFHGKSINVINASAVLLSLYSYLLGYFFPKCYIILFKPEKNTEQYFQDLIQCYTRSASSF
ncbi:taste receptor type 1 member 2-like, partial [Oryzias melastigma]|uniref:taste receptor type 1 member 2-like n=1 Tax=Oryzias melastigma TaxID=30732 RepID=UPI00168D65CD